jgi:hypothetical protein
MGHALTVVAGERVVAGGMFTERHVGFVLAIRSKITNQCEVNIELPILALKLLHKNFKRSS